MHGHHRGEGTSRPHGDEAAARIDPWPYFHPTEPRPRPRHFDARLFHQGTHVPSIPLS
jgi:hypothetical protein